MIVLYSTGCPKCKVLSDKLQKNNLSYVLCSNEEEMLKRGFTTVPVLEVDGIIMNFKDAVTWINAQNR